MSTSYGLIVHTVRPNETLGTIAQRYRTTVQAIVSANPSLSMGMIFPGQRLYIWPVFNPGENSQALEVKKDETKSKTETASGTETISRAESDLTSRMRILWERHTAWIRLAIVSMVFDLPDATLVTNRLLKSSEDFASILSRYYGSDKSSSFSELLRGQLVLITALINEAKAGDSEAALNTEKRLNDNVRNMAILLASFNPFWSKEEWESMLLEYLSLVKLQTLDMLNQKYQEGIDIFEEMGKQAIKMADTMTSGIVKQFPEKFRV